uniref:patatin-like phospholipase family protein n=1 Tax=Ensifer adhaerens TaxID=106592 RepID=UPI003F49A510
MSQDIEIELCFQGGGAKLASLIAVAQAAYSDLPEHQIRVVGVSGTSAGAIAAAILASGIDPGKFRSRLQDIGPTYLGRLRWTKWLRMGLPLIGLPFASRAFLEDFIADLFTIDGKQIQTVADLKLPLDVFSTNIRTGKSIARGRNPSDELREILADSASIPLVFHGYLSRSDKVDGGLINNLPVSHRLSEGAELMSPVVAITFFQEETLRRKRWPLSYVKSLISTSIDSHVHNSLDSLSLSNIHVVRTKTTTLNFKRALEEDLGDTIYGAHRDSFVDFAKAYKKRFQEHANYLTIGTVASRLVNYHDRAFKRSEVRVVSAVYSWQCNCLSAGDPSVNDTCDVEYWMIPEGDDVLSFGIQHLSGNEFYHMGDIEVQVEDDTGARVASETFALPPKFMKDSAGKNNLIIQFDHPLQKGKKYRLHYQVFAREVLFDLSKPARTDTVAFQVVNMQEVEEVKLITYVPSGIVGKVRLTPLEEPKGAVVTQYVEGRKLTDKEVEKLPRRIGFHPIGWVSTNMKKGQATGYLAVSVL